ncbi:MAG: VCBS repeat-containing protein [Gemmatales bacterium]
MARSSPVTPITPAAPYRESHGDYNEDGYDDCVVLNSYVSNQFSICYGNPDGTYQQPHSYYLPGGGSSELETADFNGDGHLDLIEANGQVELGRGDGSFYGIQTNVGFNGSYMALGDFNGDGAMDAVATGFGTTANTMSNANNDQSLVGSAVGLSLNAPATAVAGVPFNVTVTALDANGNVATNFLGMVAFTNPLNPAQTISYTFTAADAGVHTVVGGGVLLASGPQTLFATSPFLPKASTSVLVTPATATHFQVSGPGTVTAGDPTTAITVTALDAFNNVAPSYTGTVRFASTDLQAVLPANYTFTSVDAGVHAFNVTLKTTGTQSVQSMDTLSGISGSTLGINVTPGAAVGLTILGGGGYVGSPHVVAVYAVDQFGNTATSYNGTVHLTTSDALATLSADGPITNGVGFFTITPRTLGTQTITAVDTNNGAFLASESVLVTPGQGVSFTVTPLANAVAGTAQSMKVTVYDAFGNISTVYNGTMQITSTDPTATQWYTFTAADAGVHTFTVALKTAGTHSVTVADTVTAGMSSTQTGIVVTPGVAASIQATPLVGTTAGVAQNVKISARDAYGNISTGYRGTLAFSSSDAQIVMLPSYAYTAADAGSHVFSVTFKSARGQTFTATDTVNPALTYSQRDINITAAAMSGFAFLRLPALRRVLPSQLL